MARSRNIKPGFFENEYLAELSPYARLLFIGLWTLADREGRLEDRPKRIEAALFPYDNIDINSLLNELENSKGDFITRCEVDGYQCIQVLNFTKHQNPHRNEKEADLPPPPRDLDRAARDLERVTPEITGATREERGIMNQESGNMNQENAPPKKSKKFKFNDDQMNFAMLMWERVHEIAPYQKKPNLEEWADTIRKINELDEYTLDQIADVFVWAHEHKGEKFSWSQQIRSPSNLREHWEKLMSQSGLWAKWAKGA